MALLERVSTLIRANLNDLLSKAEDPEKLARQLVLDMENQLMQVKTQVAIAIADQHLLDKRQVEQRDLHTQWLRKAELAVNKQQDDLARAALERALSHQRLAEGLSQQQADQATDTDNLRTAYNRLQHKLTETQAHVEQLTAELRRSRAAQRALKTLDQLPTQHKLRELANQVNQQQAQAHATRTLLAQDSLEEHFEASQRNEDIEALLLELKQRQPRLG